MNTQACLTSARAEARSEGYAELTSINPVADLRKFLTLYFLSKYFTLVTKLMTTAAHHVPPESSPALFHLIPQCSVAGTTLVPILTWGHQGPRETKDSAPADGSTFV